ncbi:MAG TPA: RsmD family RNA methyltransferase, partial [Candidatus Pelethomonas intestinigallinarum]|nr:RsmD family RNA methyltransferase [Candidatus Pelethomonas intestinigallinarum]
EQRRDAAALVRENLKITGLGENARVVNGEALAFLASCGEKFDLIFLDPPYAAELWDSALEAISRFDILSNHGIIICESPAERVMPELAPPYRVHRTYRYGRIKVTTYHREEGDEA